MTKPVVGPAFYQVTWVVRDIAAAEKLFVDAMGTKRFLHSDRLRKRAKDRLTPRVKTRRAVA
jgi:hypothetical protein